MRNLRIDFFRGLALVIIFIDHVYDNRLGGYTLRGYGIADAGEIFFFCSGFVAAVVYGGMMSRDGFVFTQWKAARRAVFIYVFHVGAFLMLVGICAIVKDLEGVRTVVQARLLHEVIYGNALVGLQVLTLNYQPFLFTILPAYIVLSLATPFFTRLQLWSPMLLFGGSLTLYLLVQNYSGINFEQGPYEGPWVFNPFAYQFLFVIGMLFGARYSEGRLNIPMRMDLAIGAIVLLFVVFVFHNFIPFLQKHFQLFADYPLPRGLPLTGKIDEEPLRIVHFLVLAYAVLYVLNLTRARAGGAYRALARLATPVVHCGRSSIYIFTLGIILSYLGGFVIATYGNGAFVWIPVNAAGITVMLAAGTAIARKRAEMRDRTQRSTEAALRPGGAAVLSGLRARGRTRSR